MTLLHVSDLRFNKTWFRWLSSAAPPHDVLVITGELLDVSARPEGGPQADWVASWLREHPRPVVLAGGGPAGPWDGDLSLWWTDRWLASLAGEHVTVPGGVTEEDGVTIYSHPSGAGAGRVADIWAVRTPPAGPGVAWHDTGHGGGDADLLYLIRRYGPRLVLCGHVPSPLSWVDHFEGVLYLNPGVGDSPRVPNHILVDLDAGMVRHRALAADGRVHESLLGLGASVAEPAEFEPVPDADSSEPLLVN
jgi:hypothetical protein